MADPEQYGKEYKEWNMDVLPMMTKHWKLELSRTTVEQRRMIVDAAWECCEMLKAAGVPVNDAENTDRYREGTKQRKKTERMVYWMAQTVVGKWCISDHAMRAVSEMQYLDEAFAALRATTLVEMTAWDELRRSLPRKK